MADSGHLRPMIDEPTEHEVLPPAIERIFGPLGSAVLRIMWQRDEATVADVANAVARARAAPTPIPRS